MLVVFIFLFIYLFFASRLLTVLAPDHDYELTMFLAVRGWLDQCLERLDLITYKTCLADQELWEPFPNIIDILLRRE